ncbi:MAG: oxygen-independent coproporphyrinogen III oxidase [Burkholderiaceae bacterium]
MTSIVVPIVPVSETGSETGGPAGARACPSERTAIPLTPTSGPRYTSYPTADRFDDRIDASALRRALRARRDDPRRAGAPLSLYVHVPFCQSVCYYCACNKVVTKQYGKATEYLSFFEREVDLLVAELGPGAPVGQLHLGGGTPTYLDDDDLRGLLGLLRSRFALRPDAEMSIEVDPRTVDAGRLALLAELGFNRLSFGVQDFDPLVQKAVHRIQSAEQVFALVRSARELGFRSINVDLIHGLPMQTEASFARTIDSVIALRPDRVAVYAYAHLPTRFKPQRRIDAADLPSPQARMTMHRRTIESLTDAGYVYIGMDHFALPDDGLSVARRERSLHRNFQGYSTQADCDLIAIGVSGISKIGDTFSQNARGLDEYYRMIDEGRLPVVRGWTLTDDDRLRRDLIMALMCQGRVDRAAMAREHRIDFDAYFADELRDLAPFAEQGLARIDDDAIVVTDAGWYVVRAIAMVFDAYLRRSGDLSRFSRIL